MFCENCGAKIPRRTCYCASCGAKIAYGHDISMGEMLSGMSGNMLDALGVARIEKFSFRDLLSEALKKHSREEREEHFLVGTIKTTPQISMVKCEWPKPWMFLRCFVTSVVLYFVFSLGLKWFENPNLIPGLVLLGSVAVPVSVAVFFFELNVWKNISLFELGKFIVAGGVMSILIALLFFQLYGSDLSWLSAASAGILEEPAKLAALVWISRNMNYHYKLNGLILGAAIGTGFAIFESMGYSMCALLGAEDFDSGISALNRITIFRGVLSPFCHIVWTAIAGAALWRVCEGRPKASDFTNMRFLRLFALPVICHMIWNFSAEQLNIMFLLVLLVEAFVVWKVVLSLTNEGIEEVALRQGNIQC